MQHHPFHRSGAAGPARFAIVLGATAVFFVAAGGCGGGDNGRHGADDLNRPAPQVRGATFRRAAADESREAAPDARAAGPIEGPALAPDAASGAGDHGRALALDARSGGWGDGGTVAPDASSAGAGVRDEPTAADPPRAAGGPWTRSLPEGPLGKPDKAKPDYLRISFNELSAFDYDPFEVEIPQSDGGEDGSGAATGAGVAGPTRLIAQIPESILALNGKNVVVQGFMVPIEVRKDDVKSFLLVRNQMVCCFGVMVSFNEWIFVQMEGDKRAKFIPDTLVSVYGKFDVGEDIQNGLVMSIYRLEGHETAFSSGF